MNINLIYVLNYYSKEVNVTYENYINMIISERGRRLQCGKYYETHHIIPKCCGGDNSENNTIDLYPEEHYIAHKLLAMENPENEKL